MSVAAVKQFVGRIVSQLQDPTPFDVFTHVPKQDEVGSRSMLVVSIPQSRETRKALGYVTGLKQVDHTVQLDVAMSYDDAQVGGALYDSAIEKIDQLLRLAARQMPQVLSDPDTGVESTVVMLAEEIQTQTRDPVLADSAAGTLIFLGTKIVSLSEEVVG